MPPKSRRQLRRSEDGADYGAEVSDGASPAQVSGRRAARGKGKAADVRILNSHARRNKANERQKSANAVPNIFQDMLAEALSTPKAEVAERPRKRRRVRQWGNPVNISSLTYATHNESHSDDDASLEFEDVVPSKQEQTAYNDSEDDSMEDDFAWEEVGNTKFPSNSSDAEGDDGDLDLTLGVERSPQKSSPATRRKVLNKADRALRLSVHKMHILCLLSHVDRRNNWCNDSEVQRTLKSLLTKQIMECFKPKESYTQFGKAESVKKGLSLVIKIWESSYSITVKGMQRPYWAESEQEVRKFKLGPESDSLHEKSEFRLAAKRLEGSRDTGTQLFCAMLRSAGLDVRLACSLQPLPFSAKGSALNETRSFLVAAESPTPEARGGDASVDVHRGDSSLSIGGSGAPGIPMPFTARRRLGHPNAADYFMPIANLQSSASLQPKSKQKRIHESPYPVFWVEVLDEAHQKWMPVNSMDPAYLNKPREFEPPASDLDNNLSYVIAFEDDGAAQDVTRRYAKAFSAKTLKNRVESTEGGERWWRTTMKFYSRGWKSDLDQIEDTELASAQAREPMPKSVADFKNHPVYALERHLKRNEVLVDQKEVGKVAAGRDANSGKRLESVYRRNDVKLVKSADGWYRLGREVIVGEQPVKIVAPRKQGDDIEDEEHAGTTLYTESQTELYQAPPVVNGRIPKNSYGNLDIYVPSMIPHGGVHIPGEPDRTHFEETVLITTDPEASRAARILGLDYADAVTGFEFRGRHGTAIINGIVAAAEYKDGIEAVIDGFRDEQAQLEEDMRSLAALRMWKRLMVGLRIKERVDGYKIEGEEGATEAVGNDSGVESEEYLDDGGGGFFP